MGRIKIINKNKIKSVSLPIHQIKFIENNKSFDLSKFLQIHLQTFIELSNELKELEGGN